MFTAIVCLLILDGLVIAWSCGRRRRLSRLRRDRVFRCAVVPNETPPALRSNEDLARRQAERQAHRSAHPAAYAASSGKAQETVRRVVAVAGFEIRRAAERLEAMPELVYDAAIWETSGGTGPDRA